MYLTEFDIRVTISGVELNCMRTNRLLDIGDEPNMNPVSTHVEASHHAMSFLSVTMRGRYITE